MSDQEKKEKWKWEFDKEAFSEWYHNISMPEIGMGETLFISIFALVGGIIIGTQCALWVQAVLLVSVIVINCSRPVSRLEIGGIAYIIISFVLFIGIVIGDISIFYKCVLK